MEAGKAIGFGLWFLFLAVAGFLLHYYTYDDKAGGADKTLGGIMTLWSIVLFVFAFVFIAHSISKLFN